MKKGQDNRGEGRRAMLRGVKIERCRGRRGKGNGEDGRAEEGG